MVIDAALGLCLRDADLVHSYAESRHLAHDTLTNIPAANQVQDERFIAIAEAMLLRFASLSPVQRYASDLPAINCPAPLPCTLARHTLY